MNKIYNNLNIDLLKNSELTVKEMEAIVVLLESGFFQKILFQNKKSTL